MSGARDSGIGGGPEDEERERREAQGEVPAAIVEDDEAAPEPIEDVEDAEEEVEDFEDAEEEAEEVDVMAAEAMAAAAALAVAAHLNAQGGGPAGAREPRINANQLAILGKFKGEESEDIEEFILLVERCITAFTWDQQMTSAMVQTSLEGAAARWLRSLLKLSTPADHMDDWIHDVEVNGVRVVSGLKKFMLARFKEAMNERGAVEAISDLKQKAGEIVSDFYDRVVLAMDRKNYRDTPADRREPAYKEKLKMDTYTFFAAGLQEDIRRQALGGPSPPATCELLLTAARNAELEKRKATTKPKYLSEITGEGEGTAEGETSAAFQLSELRNELAALKSQFSGNANVECWNCHKNGHISFNCPSPKRTSPGGFRGRAPAGPRRFPPRTGGPRKFVVRPAQRRSAPSRMTVKRGGKIYELVETQDQDQQEGDDPDVLEFEEVEQDQGDEYGWNWPDPNGQ